MTTWTGNPLLRAIHPAQPDYETEMVTRLSQAASEAGICLDQTAIVNFYVALKSKPLTILTGPEQSGKIALVQCLTRILLGGDCEQCQIMLGHPWSFEKSDNVAQFTEVQMRFNTDKLLCLIEEAWQPENAHRVFIACVTRISPAELLSFFTEVAFQLRHGQLMRLGDVHFFEPVPFPSNLFLIGTMDTQNFDWWDPDLLSQTTVIQWPKVGLLPCPFQKRITPTGEREFLRSCLRNRQSVYHRVHSILGWQRQPLRPLFQVEALFRAHAVPFLYSVIDETMIYLANSWSRLGNGLFDPSTSHNLRIALDLAIAQILLPRAVEAIRSMAVLPEQLQALLAGKYPRSAAFVSSLADQG